MRPLGVYMRAAAAEVPWGCDACHKHEAGTGHHNKQNVVALLVSQRRIEIEL